MLIPSNSVVALSKLYTLHDPRLAAIKVKGDLIVQPSTSNRIMTRSRARQTPDQYTIIPAPLKIIKILVEELLTSNSGNVTAHTGADGATNDDNNDEGGDDDEDWEDDPNDFLDLGAGMTKAQLMAYGEEDGPGTGGFERGRDDETQSYLLQFFREQGRDERFAGTFAELTEEEREKLRRMGDA